MISWEEFRSKESELAKAGEGLIFQFGVGLAFLATIRKDGAPRLHPVCPVLWNGHLYVFIAPQSPKKNDLLRDGRYAMQSFPPPREESEEFYLSGRAERIEDRQLFKQVMASAKSRVHEDEILFELKLDRAMHTTWANWGKPDLHPVYQKWHL